MQIKVAGGRIIDPAQNIDEIADLYIVKGLIAGIGEEPEGFTADETIDATGQIVCPGLIDLSAHLREPGQTQKGNIASETAAAAAGGITMLVSQPTTSPVVDSTAVAELVQDRATDAGMARVLPLGALTQGLAGEQLAPLHALASSGCIGFTNARKPIDSSLVLLRALEYAATHDLLVVFQAQDRSLAAGGCMHDGTTATRLGLSGIPSAAETIEVSRCLLLVEETGVRAHFGQLSSQQSIHLIDNARKRGLRVTADVAIHHLLLTDEQVDGFNALFHVIPPLRSQLDRAGLRQGLVTDTIEAICSDHQPQDEISKQAPFAATEPGISGFETLLPLSLMLVEEKLLELPQLIEKLTVAPARVLGIEAGTLEVGTAADVCVFDPEAVWKVTPQALRSQGKNTPFLNCDLKGQVTATILDGRPVYRRA
ncbi:dihydroorotase [Marinobacterium sp. LSUCC0821]|uniref:dihydroorotase n=1 Tax=Marinobacterium sp. LSUCC0821 TaxID=2668067 RepID=UPI0014513B29|nr:dihydroorotase [Marinobacterium sp. LSUCC0821]QJD71936.1 dihydroorotase [Marinobacterium sp. LSUCC0821]